MKTFLTLGLAVLAFSGATAQPQPIKDSMHTVYDNLQKAYNKGDVDAISSFFSSDFHWRQLDGKQLSLEQAKKEIKEELNNIQSGKWKVEIVNVIGSGPVATAVAQFTFRGVMLDDSHKPYKEYLVSTERQNWIQGHNGWKMVSDSILNSSSKQDGTNVKANVKATGQPVQNTNAAGSDSGY